MLKKVKNLRRHLKLKSLLRILMNNTNGFIKKTSSNTFYAVIENRHMKQIIDEKFKILDLATQYKNICKISADIFVGVGLGADSLAESEKIAKQCIDMALGRGGDQAVVKTENGYRFFGGVSKGIKTFSC